MKDLVLVLYVAGLIHSGIGQLVQDGLCDPNVLPVEDFIAADYLGTWFLIESLPSANQNGDCIDATYSLGANGLVDVFNTQVVNQTLDTITGTANITGSGMLEVSFPVSPVTSDYWVLATDYDDYALVYSCLDLTNETRAVWSWKLSRTRSLSANASLSINEVVRTVDGLNNTVYDVIDHSEAACFYFPEHDPSTPVKFRARCDESIGVVQDFNATRYMGLWHLIESYPSAFQAGSCNNAYYSLGADSVEVLNSQVVNQTLETVRGTAVVASTDGSAILNVSFPIPGTGLMTQSPYWVLDTDYDSYALVYTCVESEGEYIQVNSWKLSRTKVLPATAVAAINNVTDGIQVLDSRYYNTVDQSSDGCFYLPEPQPGVPVEFPGVCDTTIGVVEDFDLTAFAGDWNVVEAYPNSFQEGQCFNHSYSLNADSTLSLQVTQVVNQSQSFTTATLRRASTWDPASKMTLTSINGGITNLPFWILDTDYEDYALAYSCLNNFGQDTRSVYSWKLSRSRSLSVNAQAAINNVTSSIDVINDAFFESVDQSDNGCFYLPDITEGEPAIFPGQCDQSIPVVQNFNASRYLGNWRLIETYFSEFQSGTCNQADYSPAADGSVIVLNSQVIDERLDSITGRAIVVSDDGSAKLQVTFPNNQSAVDYWVLDTDYDSYSLVYSCNNINTQQRRVFAWKLSRDRTLSPTAEAAINSVVNTIDVLNPRYFAPVDQSDAGCFHYPQFDELPGSITLPGPCDPSIRGIPDFNASLYLGRWIEIEKYPQLFQLGECHRAEYSLGDDVVDVYNTQVFNQTLLSQGGTAVVASTDGTGELLVTFNVSGIINVANYIVLATDYDNFALVYSCRNLTDGDRQVSSWKLSRNTTLTTSANNTINAVIANTQGLLPDYYTVTDQSEEACFYIPEVVEDQPVLIRGSCPVVSGQSNFDVQRYLGWWHHIRNYPTGEDTGTCISTQYQQAGNQIEFVDTQVFGLTGHVTRGTVVANSNGLLRKTWNNGANSQDVWVLATDYETYSLLFTCEPYDDDYVKVWSSVQSKSRSLTATAEQAIASVVANNALLISDAFLPVSQSDEACFHYPESSGQVVLPGQCNPTIPVQANFDVEGYSGVWYQIERYPYPQVSADSTCIGARYTPSGDVIQVLNWEVVGDELRTIEGEATVVSNAVFNVSLPAGEGQQSTARIYILSTDYESYSLAYTCENINQFERVVVAFKMSRSRELTSEASSAIATFMNSWEELHQPLFITVPQSEDCEEPNSSFLIRSSIIVVLVCYAFNILM